MGVHKFTPIPAIEGDVGLLPTYYRHKLEIIRLCNRLILMDNSRLAKKMFLCNYSNPKVNDWPTQVRRIFESMGSSIFIIMFKCVILVTLRIFCLIIMQKPGMQV